jgi:hypothetical protein
MGTPLRLGLSSLLIAAALPLACGSDDDNRSANPNCAAIGDPCRRCSCQICACNSECERGLAAYADCVDGCFTLSGGEAVNNCMKGCENAANSSTRANLACTASAVDDECQPVCEG